MKSPVASVSDGEPTAVTLKQAIDRDGVPPPPSSKQRRLMDVHVTAYPSLVNTRMLPQHQTTVKDFSSIDPTKYRKEHTVRNNNAGSYAAKDESVLDVVSTSQFANRMMQLGVQMRAERAANPSTAPAAKSLDARGFHSRLLAPPFDVRSTYRWDYCQEDLDDGATAAVRQAQLATYRDEWSANEKGDVDASMRVPYLTLPVSSDRLKDKATVYRKDFMPGATSEEFRMLSHKTDLSELGTTFAYSGYAVDDPRREVPFDAAVASVTNMHSVLEKSFSPRASFAKKHGGATLSAKEELEQLRAMRRETMQRSVATRHASSTAARVAPRPDRFSSSSEEGSGQPVIIPGIKGSGYRRSMSNNDDYVYLPRDHFCYQAVDDF